jgi:hypothetical protein
MNIVYTEKEYDLSIMLYLKDRIENIDNLDLLNPDGSENKFNKFVYELKSKSFFETLNKAYLDASMMQKVNIKKMINEKNKLKMSKIRILI